MFYGKEVQKTVEQREGEYWTKSMKETEGRGIREQKVGMVDKPK